MSTKATLTKTFSLGGTSFPQSAVVEGDAMLVQDVSVAAAEAGALSTRTDADTGEITMTDSGHAITTGLVVDVYWATGQRLGMTVGTVSGAAVPIDGGAGDNLPTASTAVTVKVPQELDVLLDGDKIQAIILYAASKGAFVFEDSSVAALTKVLAAANSWEWHYNNGETNPVAGDDIDTIKLSHGQTSAVTMRVGIVFNK